MVIAPSVVLPILKNESLIGCVIIDTKFWYQLLIYDIWEKQVDKIISSHLRRPIFFCSCFLTTYTALLMRKSRLHLASQIWEFSGTNEHQSDRVVKFFTSLLSIGQLHDDIILLQLLKSFSLLFSRANKGYCFLNIGEIDKFKLLSEDEVNCGSCNQMSSSWKWP